MSANGVENNAADTPRIPLTVGRIGQPFGVKGWLRVMSYCEPPDNILHYDSWWLRSPVCGKAQAVWSRCRVREIKPHGKGYVCHFEGLTDRESALALRGAEIVIERDELPDLSENDFYWYQLVGLPVRTIAGESLGSIDSLLETGANDVVVVKPTPESIDERRRLIPYRFGEVVKSISLEPACMVVDWDVDF
ncbi:MAG: ribosome maturation factor RimM [Gammaproteobacteria bacterium]